MSQFSPSAEPAAPAAPPAGGPTYRGPFAIMTILFFMWGFMTVFNDILIPRFKEAFTLNYLQAMLVQFAFFGAYSIGSFFYFVISAWQGDPIARMGYKNGVVVGLLLAAAGSALFWPAATVHSYLFFLVALFVVGLGFAMLQIAANPYVTILGPERTASSRLNLAQAFNSVGTTTGPLIGGYLILQYFAKTGAHGAESVKVPYLIFCIVFVLLAVFFFSIHLPHVGEGKIEPGSGALKHPHVLLGVLAIFMYVGGEVSVGSAIINFLGQPNVAALSALEASKYVSLFWGGMLIGRFMGAVELSEMKKINKQLFLAGIPVLAFLIVCLASGWHLAETQSGTEHRCGSLFPGRLFRRWFWDGKNVSAVARALLAALSIRQGSGQPHAVRFLGDDCRFAGGGDFVRRQTGHVVHRRHRFVHLHRLAEYFLARAGPDGRLQKPGVVPAGDGRGGRGDSARDFGARRGCLESSGRLHRSPGRPTPMWPSTAGKATGLAAATRPPDGRARRLIGTGNGKRTGSLCQFSETIGAMGRAALPRRRA